MSAAAAILAVTSLCGIMVGLIPLLLVAIWIAETSKFIKPAKRRRR